MIKAFQDSIERQPPEFVTLDRLRAATVSKLSSLYNDSQPLTRPRSLNPITTNSTNTNKQKTTSTPDIENTGL